MDVNGLIDLAVQYGLNGALLVFMIIKFTQLSNKLMEVIEKNSKVIGEVTVEIEKCKRK